MHIIFIVLVVYRACPMKFLVSPDRRPAIPSCKPRFRRVASSVALESPRSNQTSAWAGPETISAPAAPLPLAVLKGCVRVRCEAQWVSGYHSSIVPGLTFVFLVPEP